MRFRCPHFVVSLLLLMPLVGRAQDPVVTAQVSGRTVYLGEPFAYSVRVDDLEELKLVPLKTNDFDVRGPSAPELMQSSFYANGRVTHSISSSFRYVLTAKKAGDFTIPAAVIEANGLKYRSKSIRITVVGPQASDLFKLSARANPAKIYPMQKFDVELTIDLRELDKPLSVISPVSGRVLQNSNPRLSIPWFRDAEVPNGIQSTAELDLRKFQSLDGSGFQIPQAPRYSFRQRPFLPPEDKVQLPKLSSNSADEDDEDATTWFRYKLRRSFFSTRTGTYQLGRGSLQGQLISKIEGTRGELKTVFGLTDPITVEVLPLPLDSRPDSWVGVIGDLDVRAEITPTAARVGEPLTLQLTLAGTGSLKDAFAPELSKREGIAENFRVYEPTSRQTQTGKTFTYSLRAKKAGTVAFPPIELAWFDPLRGDYVTGATSPIELKVEESQSLAADDIVSSAMPTAASNPVGGSTVADPTGLAANLTSLTNESVQPQQWLIAWGAITAIGCVAWFFLGREKSARSVILARQAACFAAARKQLAEGGQLLSQGKQVEGMSRVRESINSAVRGLTGSEVEGLTTEDVAERLSAASVDADLAKATNELLQTLDVARYGGALAASDVQESANRVVPALIDAVKKSEPIA